MPSQLTLKDAAPQYLERLRAAGKNEHTVKTYGRALEVIAGFFGEAKALKALRPADVGRFLKSDALLKKPNGRERAKPTIDQIVRVLRMLLEWAQAQGHVQTLAFPQDALPKRRRRQPAQPQETTPQETPPAS
ncbi:MAG TPA: hypothetical protein PLE19_22445 [Planctomycetota bacterium]|nr:hypothetical protein [Planctomycetota bacterium]HRR83289.1 hypothetical protein [Planctomycetota bacterium]HRT97468.1 hypothetical protein [Planctomycetota bacterium]